MKDLYKLKIDKKYGEWYYAYTEGKRMADITYFLYDKDKKQVGKFNAFYQIRDAILSEDIKAYQNKYCSFGDYDVCINGKWVAKDNELDLSV